MLNPVMIAQNLTKAFFFENRARVQLYLFFICFQKYFILENNGIFCDVKLFLFRVQTLNKNLFTNKIKYLDPNHTIDFIKLGVFEVGNPFILYTKYFVR